MTVLNSIIVALGFFMLMADGYKIFNKDAFIAETISAADNLDKHVKNMLFYQMLIDLLIIMLGISSVGS